MPAWYLSSLLIENLNKYDMVMFMQVLFYGFIIYLYLSVFLVISTIYTGRNFDHQPIFGINVLNNYFFFTGSLIGLTIFFGAGFERALFFIPENWGGLNEEGEWQALKGTLAYGLAFFTTLGLLQKVEKLLLKKGRE